MKIPLNANSDSTAGERLNTSICTLGIINPKNAQNMGSIIRAAGCYGVNSIFYSGQRYGYARRFHTDTQNKAAEIPLVGCHDVLEMKPSGARVVAVELVEGAIPLPDYEHPDNAFYIFGPEDGSVSQTTLNQCDDVVYIPTNGCMNLAATVNVLLYDRLAKLSHIQGNDLLIKRSRDNNNKLKI